MLILAGKAILFSYVIGPHTSPDSRLEMLQLPEGRKPACNLKIPSFCWGEFHLLINLIAFASSEVVKMQEAALPETVVPYI